ncbi:MAG: phosphoribosylformylglycinamidine synthase subunit PurL [Proteobacteria bacterium]|nr:phosphoribosylformylglycinamidine synthase subunit PurL [Pseudomonadota bacterium]
MRGWSLDQLEMTAVQTHFKTLRREPTLAEMETIAQTWSEHCKHKTFTSPIRYVEGKKTRRFTSLLKETVMDATKKLNKSWCLSVFKDNAGIVKFGDKWAAAYKVETHNHPCAVEPYGGSTTGLGGVIRDVLGAGLGAKPIMNTDVFCVAPPDYDGELPDGTLHPRRTLGSVVAGVRDYGNRMGIPTPAGSLWFDKEYLYNPLVFCGTVGLMPTWAIDKEVKPGDLIVAAGGRTGRDGLHGATFSSASLDDSTSASAVQIGHAIVEKRLLDALLQARDRKLYRAVTDCGAGGFSSAIGELGADCGARVTLEKAPLKASDLSPWEIWLSESQERMVFAVPPRNLKAMEAVFAAEDCELAVLGEFTSTKRLEVLHNGATVVSLDMKFLHDGLPRRERLAVWNPPKSASGKKAWVDGVHNGRISEALYAILGHLNVCSRAWIIRQYDHEVQAGTVIKPLQGAEHDGPGDACVIWPHAATGDMEDFRGLSVSHGMNPNYGKIDPYAMALLCADEALRNLTCVGADVSQASLLDNFCWGNPEEPTVLGSMVRAALGCRDAALGFETPFISGKDSLYNEYVLPKSAGKANSKRSIPGTLLISAMAPVHDVRKSVTMDFKAPNNPIFLIGRTTSELGGSLFAEWLQQPGGGVPQVDLKSAKETMRKLSAAIAKGLAAACHDLSEGGLAVALSEMAFAGEIGASIDLDTVPRPRELEDEATILFSESPSRFLVEVPADKEKAFLKAMKGATIAKIGTTIANPVLRWKGLDGSQQGEEPLSVLKATWVRPLPAAMGGRRAPVGGGSNGSMGNGGGR